MPGIVGFKNRNLVSLSTAEARYIALAASTEAVVSAKRMLITLKTTDTIKTDNQAAFDSLDEPVCTKIRKFIDLRHYSLQGKTNSFHLVVPHVPAVQHSADMFSKSLKRVIFGARLRLVGIHHSPPNMAHLRRCVRD